jgi:serine/threonine protein kinase
MSFRFTRKRRGGAFEAKGSYGCVFKKPPLKCKADATRRNNTFISKLSKNNVAVEEYEQSEIIKHFDPHMQYFVTADSLCQLNSANIRPENEFAKCNLKEVKNAERAGNYSNLAMVMYKDAGTDLHRLKLKVNDYIPFYESLVNLFNALKFIHSKGIIHHDIKSDNLIAQKNPDGSFTTRLIDVGFTCPLKPVTGPHNAELNRIQHTYSHYCLFTHFKRRARSYGPFYEYMFYYTGKGVKSRLQKYRENQMEYLTEYTTWVNDIAKYLGSDDPFKKEDGKPRYMYEDVMDALLEIWGDKVDKHFTTQNVDPDFVLQLTSAADVFSLGLVLVKIQRRYLTHTVDRKGGSLKAFVPRSTQLRNAGAPDVWVPVEALAGYGVPAAQAAWHVAVADRISIPLHVLMTRMAKLDPRDAININEALGEYTAILDAVRELYTPQKVYDGLKAIDEFPELAAPSAAPAAKSSSTTPSPPKSSSSSKAAPAKPPSPPKPTSTAKLDLDEAQKKALAKKKRAVERAKEDAKEEVDEALEELSELKKKQRDQENKMDQAKRDKMAAGVIEKFVKAIEKYANLVRKKEISIEEMRIEGQEAIEAAERAYAEFRAGLPRL